MRSRYLTIAFILGTALYASGDVYTHTEYAAFEGQLNGEGDIGTQGATVTSQVLTTDGATLAVGGTLLTALENFGGSAKLFAVDDEIELKEVNKGGAYLPEETFTVTATSTLSDFCDWMEGVLGIATILKHDTNLTTPTSGVRVTAGQIEIIGNIGESNDFTFGTGAFQVSGSVPFTFTQTDGTHANGDSIRTSFPAYDSLGIPFDVDVTMAMESKSTHGITWRFFAECSDDSDADRVIGTGIIRFDTTGQYLEGTHLSLQLDLSGTGAMTPQYIRLDFSQVDSSFMESNLSYQIDGLSYKVPAEFATIQAAIDFAFDRDQVLVEPGTYYENIHLLGKCLEVVGREGPEHTIIDGRGLGSVVTNQTLDGSYWVAVIKGLTLRNGYNTYGGGVYSDTGLAIINCQIINNRAVKGGGIYGGPNSAILPTNTVIAHNTARQGGGIAVFSSWVPIYNCTITQNGDNSSSSSGGAIYASDSQMGASETIFWDNYAAMGSEFTLKNGSIFQVGYCDVMGGQTRIYKESSYLGWLYGNLSVDPCFADPQAGDYHLKSQGWRWDPQLGAAGGWTWDEVTSRCIDAGRPEQYLNEEPVTLWFDLDHEFGVNVRIDMGAYGGTAQASIAPHGWALPWDADNNGVVNLIDYAYLVQNWEYAGVEDLVVLAEDWLATTMWH